MRDLIEYDHLSINGRMSGDSWWAGQREVVPNDNHFAYQLRLLSSAVGLVLGRATYAGFAQTWPTMTGEVADKINSLPKHVASTTLTETTWNAQVLAGDAVDAVARLKAAGDGTLVKYCNGPVQPGAARGRTARRTAPEHLPFIAGSGESLLSGIRTTAMDLTKVTELGNGTVVLTYTPSR